MDECSESVALLKVQEILTAHRTALIDRLLADLGTYVGYRFSVKRWSVSQKYPGGGLPGW